MEVTQAVSKDFEGRDAPVKGKAEVGSLPPTRLMVSLRSKCVESVRQLQQI